MLARNWKWVQIGQDIYGNNLAGSNVENAWEGEALALSGDGNTLITGSYNVDNERGRARVFRYEEDSNVWVKLGDNFDGEKERGQLPNQTNGDTDQSCFGASVAISYDGNTVAMGAFGIDGAAGINTGRAYIYKWDDISWDLVSNFIDGEIAHEWMGYGDAISLDAAALA